jgi:transposase InsO family protein
VIESRSGIRTPEPPRPIQNGIIDQWAVKALEELRRQKQLASSSPGSAETTQEKTPGTETETSAPESVNASRGPGPVVHGREPEEDEILADEAPAVSKEEVQTAPKLSGRKKGRRLVKPEEARPKTLSPEERLLLLDTWRRSGLPAGDFASLTGLSKQTLYGWQRKFKLLGPAGLVDHQRGGPRGSRLPEVTRRTILMLKESNPDWGCQRISDMLLRGPALPASPSAVATVLKEAGYVLQEEPTRGHPDKPRGFERARPNQLWQTDLFTFVLKRQNRRVYLVAFMDDHSRFIVGYGLHATQSSALVIEVLRAAIASYQAPDEILTDNGAQYVTWRGKSAFARELEKRGIRHIVASPRHPQTLCPLPLYVSFRRHLRLLQVGFLNFISFPVSLLVRLGWAGEERDDANGLRTPAMPVLSAVVPGRSSAEGAAVCLPRAGMSGATTAHERRSLA